MEKKGARKLYRVYWSKEEMAVAVSMNEKGALPAEIGVVLGRSEDSVRGKLKTYCSLRDGGSQRPCLKCRKPFRTPDRVRVRICSRCKDENRHEYDNTAVVSCAY